MEGTLGRTCLILALLGALLAVTLSVNPGARADGATVAASGNDAVARQRRGGRRLRAARRRSGASRTTRPLKQELAFLWLIPQPTENKNFRRRATSRPNRRTDRPRAMRRGTLA